MVTHRIFNTDLYSCAHFVVASDKIMFETRKKRENMEIKEFFYLNLYLSKRSFRHRISTDAYRYSLVCGSGIVIEVTK